MLAFLGKRQEQKYKAQNEMWEHRRKGHVHATVVECI